MLPRGDQGHDHNIKQALAAAALLKLHDLGGNGVGVIRRRRRRRSAVCRRDTQNGSSRRTPDALQLAALGLLPEAASTPTLTTAPLLSPPTLTTNTQQTHLLLPRHGLVLQRLELAVDARALALDVVQALGDVGLGLGEVLYFFTWCIYRMLIQWGLVGWLGRWLVDWRVCGHGIWGPVPGREAAAEEASAFGCLSPQPPDRRRLPTCLIIAGPMSLKTLAVSSRRLSSSITISFSLLWESSCALAWTVFWMSACGAGGWTCVCGGWVGAQAKAVWKWGAKRSASGARCERRSFSSGQHLAAARGRPPLPALSGAGHLSWCHAAAAKI
jgi:hypothetical protein